MSFGNSAVLDAVDSLSAALIDVRSMTRVLADGMGAGDGGQPQSVEFEREDLYDFLHILLKRVKSAEENLVVLAENLQQMRGS